MTWKEIKEKIETFDEDTLETEALYYDENLDEPIHIEKIETHPIDKVLKTTFVIIGTFD
ncbi:MAG: hypothetical protein JST04_00880 [Bdellovibrionales bacterium]|nr:hypothetical protein [Bdellovibrionales bacterium]